MNPEIVKIIVYAIIGITVIAFTALICMGFAIKKKLLSSGQTVKRQSEFYNYPEIVTIKKTDFNDIIEMAKKADYTVVRHCKWSFKGTRLGVSLQKSNTENYLVFEGINPDRSINKMFTFKLAEITKEEANAEDSEEMSYYRLSFDYIKRRGEIMNSNDNTIIDENTLNLFLTLMEKEFCKLDGKAQIKFDV